MLRLFCLTIMTAICLGCAGESHYAESKASPAYAGEELEFTVETGKNSGSALNAADLKVSSEDTSADISGGANRRIIYTATLSVVVENFDPVEKAVSDLVKKHGGFIADANVSLDQGSERTGIWVVRVPVATFEEFLDASGDMGVPVSRQQNGQDVTEEFVDLEARIRSEKKLEERILKLLDDNTAAIKDVIEVERQLTRVRTEIERMEGKLRFLTDRTELTTVTLTIREKQDYTPPQAPGLGTQIAQTFGNSTGSISNLGKNLLLAVVACTPWLLLGAGLAFPFWWWRRRPAT